MIIGKSPTFAVDPSGVLDSTAGLQAFLWAISGSRGYLPPGNYRTSAPLVIYAKTTLSGAGAATQIFSSAATPFNFINNANFNAPYSQTKVDSNILIEKIFFNYGAMEGGGAHAVSIRMAQNVTIRDCGFNGGNDATALLACDKTLVENCVSTGTTNCAFDHWDGFSDAAVRDCSATIIAGYGLLATGVDTTGLLARVSDGFVFENVRITGPGVGCYMNAGYTGCAVQNGRISGLRLYGTTGGVIGDGAGGNHTIEDIRWINGAGAANDCAVRLAAAYGNVPQACHVDKIHIINSTTASVNAGIIQIGGSGHTIGAVACVGAAIAGGTLFYFTTNANGCVIAGPVTADPASIAGITYGLYQGNSGPFDTNTQIECFDPFSGFQRLQGAPPQFFEGIVLLKGGALITSVP